ncbi:hexokinase [Phanerochaete sordida]|uniref:Phosphotransferase n=1 Tax=Phanerochaete sordida TaxID=48140 RepID=A0A9P3L8K4_9APHY|nr:hexokinase [Phanerochaete sordida]
MAPLTAISGSSKGSEIPIFEDIEQQLTLDDGALHTITSQFLEDFRLGLGEYNHSMAMIPTFVTGVPNGTETGTFLALDLGGTNLRVCEVKLLGNHEFTLRQQKYRVSEALKTGEASALFDYLADSVDAFLTTPTVSPTTAAFNPFAGPSAIDEIDPEVDPALPLGLTFSFPVEQTALNEGKILTWTKGFSAKNAVGNDVVKLLQDAFNRKHLHVRCVALVNDTVGALLSRAYTAGGCILGAIFGTGTNGAYVEKVENITKLGDAAVRKNGGHMVVNCEWGGFNNTRTVLPTTPFDNKLDRESINPRLQAFEKFISGMYLGEITRNICLSLIDAAPRPLLFNGRSSKVLNSHYGLDTAVLSEVEAAWEAGRASDLKVKGVEGSKDPITADQTDSSAKQPPSKITALTKPNGTAHASSSHVAHLLDIDSYSAEDKSRLERIRSILIQRLDLPDEDVSLRDAAVFRWATSLVANRAAKLSACAVATVLVQTGRAKLGGGLRPEEESVVIGVDGSLIEHYPNFNAHLRESLRALVGEEVESRVDIGMAKDGSGVGAALCALQAIKQGL